MYTAEQYALITEWQTAANELKRAKGAEAAARRKVLSTFCPDPKEGANWVPLTDGWRLNVKQSYTYKVDEAALDSMRQALPAGSVDELVRFKPELNKRAYSNMLTDDQRRIFDEALIIKPASASVELVAPKEK